MIQADREVDVLVCGGGPAGRVVDCTGDGDVAARAGCAFDMGDAETGLCQPMTLMFTIYIDIHNTSGSGMDTKTWHPPAGFKYQIPYRMLVPADVDHLLVAGRCASCDHEALGSLRVMPQCGVMGQAAGVAAVLSLQQGISPRTLDVSLLPAFPHVPAALPRAPPVAKRNRVSGKRSAGRPAAPGTHEGVTAAECPSCRFWVVFFFAGALTAGPACIKLSSNAKRFLHSGDAGSRTGNRPAGRGCCTLVGRLGNDGTRSRPLTTTVIRKTPTP